MADILVTSPFQPFTLPTQFKAVFNGYIYCGTVDAVDPSVSQVQVYLVNETGDNVPVAQPLRTNAGGYLVYNGQPAKFVTDSNHSLLVQDSFHSQVWYAPDVAKIDPESLLGALGSSAGSSLVGFIQAGAGAVHRTSQEKMRESVSVKDFGAIGNGIANDKAAIETAWAYSKNIHFPAGVYYAPGLRLDGGGTLTQKSITSDGAVIKGDNLYISQMFCQYMENIKFEATGTIYIEGLRYNNWNSIEFAGFIRWGRYNTIPLSSWSTYWNKFTECRFSLGIELTLSISSANFNSNTFDTCEFRAGTQDSLMKFLETSANDGVFASNTFIGCDTSYAPVFNIVTEYISFYVTFIGGYIDTGTPMYAPGSFEANSLEILGTSNPGNGVFNTTVSADLRMTNGGARPRKNMPVGSLSYFKTEQIPSRMTGGAIRLIDSVPLPFSGQYTVSGNFEDIGAAPFDAVKFENLTVGESSVLHNVLARNGYSSYTFKATKGDLIRFTLDGNTNSDVNILLLALTPGAGVVDAIPYRTVYPADVTTIVATNAVATNLVTISPGTSIESTFYRVEVFTTNMVNGGGGEKIILDVGVATTGSLIGATLKEISRCSVNGPGGTSDDSGTLTISMTTSGVTATLVGTLSGTPSSVNCKIKLFSGETAGQV